MKKQVLLFIGFIFIAASGASAQSKTVTNADLEKFRQKRVQAETDYRENYQKMGFPSPEEMDKRRDQNRKELAELSERLRIENAAREQREREDEYLQAQYELQRRSSSSGGQYNQGAFDGSSYYPFGFGAYPFYGYSSGFYGGYSNGFNNGFNNNRFRRNRGFGRGGSFYNSITPGTVFPPQGVRINNSGVRIGVTSGGGFPARIGSPR